MIGDVCLVRHRRLHLLREPVLPRFPSSYLLQGLAIVVCPPEPHIHNAPLLLIPVRFVTSHDTPTISPPKGRSAETSGLACCKLGTALRLTWCSQFSFSARAEPRDQTGFVACVLTLGNLKSVSVVAVEICWERFVRHEEEAVCEVALFQATSSSIVVSVLSVVGARYPVDSIF